MEGTPARSGRSLIDDRGAPPTGADEPAEPSEPDEPAARSSASQSGGFASASRTGAFTLAVVTLTVLAVALAVAAAIFGWRYRSAAADEARRQAVLQAARQQIVNLVSISAGTADQDVARLLEGATGEFADEFKSRSQLFADVVKQAQVRSEGTISDAGLARLDLNSARVLVAAKATVRNTAAPQGEQRNYRLAVNLTEHGDRWLVSKVEFVP